MVRPIFLTWRSEIRPSGERLVCPVTRSNAECRLSNHTDNFVRLIPPSRPTQDLPTRRRPVFAIIKNRECERGIHALHSAGRCCCSQSRCATIATTSLQPQPTAQTSVSLWLRGNALALGAPFQWCGGRDSNPQQPDLKSGALPLSFHDDTVRFWMPMLGTHLTNHVCREQYGAGAPLARWYHQSLTSKRRRWESNPLGTALQAAAVPSGSSVLLGVCREELR